MSQPSLNTLFLLLAVGMVVFTIFLLQSRFGRKKPSYEKKEVVREIVVDIDTPKVTSEKKESLPFNIKGWAKTQMWTLLPWGLLGLTIIGVAVVYFETLWLLFEKTVNVFTDMSWANVAMLVIPVFLLLFLLRQLRSTPESKDKKGH